MAAKSGEREVKLILPNALILNLNARRLLRRRSHSATVSQALTELFEKEGWPVREMSA